MTASAPAAEMIADQSGRLGQFIGEDKRVQRDIAADVARGADKSITCGNSSAVKLVARCRALNADRPK